MNSDSESATAYKWPFVPRNCRRRNHDSVSAGRGFVGIEGVKTKADFDEPMLSLRVAKLQEGAARLYELKFDGYRALGLRTDGRVQPLSRNCRDFI